MITFLLDFHDKMNELIYILMIKTCKTNLISICIERYNNKLLYFYLMKYKKYISYVAILLSYIYYLFYVLEMHKIDNIKKIKRTKKIDYSKIKLMINTFIISQFNWKESIKTFL